MQTSHQPQVDAAILDQLRSELEGLMTELTDASRRNDELMTEKDNDLALIRDLEVQVKELTNISIFPIRILRRVLTCP